MSCIVTPAPARESWIMQRNAPLMLVKTHFLQLSHDASLQGDTKIGSLNELIYYTNGESSTQYCNHVTHN